jgi:hypothetical protein
MADVSVTGAYLTTRAPVVEGALYELRVAPVPGHVQLGVRVRAVRIVQSGEESGHHPRGVAVEFVGLEPGTRELLASYVGRGPDLVP